LASQKLSGTLASNVDLKHHRAGGGYVPVEYPPATGGLLWKAQGRAPSVGHLVIAHRISSAAKYLQTPLPSFRSDEQSIEISQLVVGSARHRRAPALHPAIPLGLRVRFYEFDLRDIGSGRVPAPFDQPVEFLQSLFTFAIPIRANSPISRSVSDGAEIQNAPPGA